MHLKELTKKKIKKSHGGARLQPFLLNVDGFLQYSAAHELWTECPNLQESDCKAVPHPTQDSLNAHLPTHRGGLRIKSKRWEREAGGGRSTGLLFPVEATGQKNRHFSVAPLPPFQSLVNTAAAHSASPHLRFPSLVSALWLCDCSCLTTVQPQVQEQSQEPDAKMPRRQQVLAMSVTSLASPAEFGSVFPRPQ